MQPTPTLDYRTTGNLAWKLSANPMLTDTVVSKKLSAAGISPMAAQAETSLAPKSSLSNVRSYNRGPAQIGGQQESRPPQMVPVINASAQSAVHKSTKPLPYGNFDEMKSQLGAAAPGLSGNVNIEEVVMREGHTQYKAAIKVVDLETKTIESFPYIVVNGMQLRHVQKYQLVSTFDDNILYLFGDQPVSVSFTCMAHDLKNANWFRSLQKFYTETASAYRAASLRKITYIAVDNWLFEGAWVELTPQNNAHEPGVVRFGISLILTGVQDLLGETLPPIGQVMPTPETSAVDAAQVYKMAENAMFAASGVQPFSGAFPEQPAALKVGAESNVLLATRNDDILSLYGGRPFDTQPSKVAMARLTTPTPPQTAADKKNYLLRRDATEQYAAAIRSYVGGNTSDTALQKNIGVAAITGNAAVRESLRRDIPTASKLVTTTPVEMSTVTRQQERTRSAYAGALPNETLIIDQRISNTPVVGIFNRNATAAETDPHAAGQRLINFGA